MTHNRRRIVYLALARLVERYGSRAVVEALDLIVRERLAHRAGRGAQHVA